MPVKAYDPYFGGEPGSAVKAYLAILKKYGKEQGKKVFYALINKRKSERRST